MKIGDIVEGRNENLVGDTFSGKFRITAIKHGRCYVEHLEGAKFVDGIGGWRNLWFREGDERIKVVDTE